MAIACFQYEFSIPLGRNRQETSASVVLSFFSTLVVTLCIFVLVLFGRDYIAFKFHVPELARFLWLLPVVSFMYGLTNALTAWASCEGLFGVIAYADVGKMTCEKTLAIGLGYVMETSAIGLLVGRVVGIAVNVVILLKGVGEKLLTDIKRSHLSFATVKRTGVQHKKFPFFSTWASLIIVVSMQLPPFFFVLYYSPTIAGYYSLAFRVVWLQNMLLGQTITQIFFPMAARELRETGTLTLIVSNTFKRIIQIAAFPLATLCFLGPLLFSIVFGQEWSEAGIYAQILSFWSFIALIYIPLRVFDILALQEVNLFINILLILGRATSLFIGVHFASPKVTLSMFVTLSAGILIGGIIWKLKVSQVSVLWAIKTLMYYVIISCIFISPVKILSAHINHNTGFMLGALGCMSILYGVFLVKTDPSYRQFISIFFDKLKKGDSTNI